DLAVADAAGLCGLADRLDGGFHAFVGKDDLDLHLGEEVDDVFGAAIQLRMSLLTPEALGLGDGDALEPDFLKGLLHLVELERLDDRLDLFHALVVSGRIKWGKIPLRQNESRKRASSPLSAMKQQGC